jgi:hypothetical protein
MDRTYAIACRECGHIQDGDPQKLNACPECNGTDCVDLDIQPVSDVKWDLVKWIAGYLLWKANILLVRPDFWLYKKRRREIRSYRPEHRSLAQFVNFAKEVSADSRSLTLCMNGKSWFDHFDLEHWKAHQPESNLFNATRYAPAMPKATWSQVCKRILNRARTHTQELEHDQKEQPEDLDHLTVDEV